MFCQLIDTFRRTNRLSCNAFCGGIFRSFILSRALLPYFRATALSAPLFFVTRYIEVCSCAEMSITSKCLLDMQSDAESEETEESFVLDLLLNSTARMFLCFHSFIVPHFNLIMHDSWDTWLGRYSD